MQIRVTGTRVPVPKFRGNESAVNVDLAHPTGTATGHNDLLFKELHDIRNGCFVGLLHTLTEGLIA